MWEVNQRPWRTMLAPAPTPGLDLPVRGRGEIRGTTATVSLRRRARPLALSLAPVSIAGLLAAEAATAQVIEMVGPRAVLVVYPLSGLGLIGLVLSVTGAPVLVAAGISLRWLLAIAPLCSLFVAFLTEADDILGRDAENLQVAYGAVILAPLLTCWLLQ